MGTVEITSSTKAQNEAARKAFGMTTDDFTIAGLVTLATVAENGLARFGFAVYVACEAGSDRNEIIAATGLSKQRVANLYRAGRYLARCGESAPSVTREATAVCEGMNGKETEAAFANLSGQALADAIRSARADLASKTRKPGKTAQEKENDLADAVKQAIVKQDATRTPADRLTVIVTEQGKVKEIGTTKAVQRKVRTMIAESFRIALLAGLNEDDVSSLLADLASEYVPVAV